MKTIAITIDAETLRALDALTRRRGTRAPAESRSAVVRIAVRRYVDELERGEREERERTIFARHRDRLHRQAKALIADQANG